MWIVSKTHQKHPDSKHWSLRMVTSWHITFITTISAMPQSETQLVGLPFAMLQ